MADDVRTDPPVRAQHPPARARPVTDLPGEAVLAHPDDLAKRWAIALIRARPLEDIDDMPFADLVRDAPSLCAQALLALQSDVELDRLTGAGAASSRADSAPARRLAVLAGAPDPAAAVVAVEALRGVLWEALLEQLHDPSARQVGDIADRLAYVCAAALAAAVHTAFARGADAGVEDADGAEGVEGAEITEDASRVHEPSARADGRVPAHGRQAVIVDERVRQPAASPVQELPQRRPPVPDAAVARSVQARPAEIAIRDVRDDRVARGEEGPAAWIGSIGGQLERFERDGLPFAVLLVEIVDIERLRRDRLPEELAALAGHMEQALAAALGSSSGLLTRERPGRCWLLMPETDHERGRELAERLARALACGSRDRTARPGRRGPLDGPLEVVVGVAACPHDAREAAALAAHADVGLYAARATLRASAG